MALPITGTTYTNTLYDATPINWQGQLSGIAAAYRQIAPTPFGFVYTVTLHVPAVPVSGSWPVNQAVLDQALAGGVGDPLQVAFLILPGDVVVSSAVATENSDGTGASYTLPAIATAQTSGYVQFGDAAHPDVGELIIGFNNSTTRYLYLQSISGTLSRWVAIAHAQTVEPPSNVPPTTPPPPPNLPPTVVQRKLLEKANPGFTCDLTRRNQYNDLVDVFVGQKVVLTVEGIRGKLGMHSRGNVITKMRWRWRADSDPPQETFMATYTLEKILGTLLPGTGTTTAAQDAAGTGAEISAFARWDTAGAGWGASWTT